MCLSIIVQHIIPLMSYPALMKGMDGDAISCPKSSICDRLGRAVRV